MISRYEEASISKIWSEEFKFNTYLEVELAILKALEETIVPIGTAKKIKELTVIDPARIYEIEKTTKHDMIAFCTSVTENIPVELSKYFHFGVTSSDIIDSSLTLQIKASLDCIIPEFNNLLNSLHKRSIEMKNVLTMGRSHGMYAEPFSFGQKLLGHYNEFARRFKELNDFYNNELTIQFSGAVGNYTIISPKNEEDAALILGVNVEPLSTQVIPRDRIAKLIDIGSRVASAIERISVEIRHLHRSEVSELFEGFSKGQKGSSTMPHKKNPISAENLTGMARFLKSHARIANDNIVLWHERDISHSSTERMYLPDHFGIMLYSIKRLTKTIDNLIFNNEEIESRVKSTYNYLSSYYLHYLIQNTSVKREELYYFVQEASFKSIDSNSSEDFFKELSIILKKENIELNLPTPNFDEIRRIYTKHVDTIFKRSLKKYPF